LIWYLRNAGVFFLLMTRTKQDPKDELQRFALQLIFRGLPHEEQDEQ